MWHQSVLSLSKKNNFPPSCEKYWPQRILPEDHKKQILGNRLPSGPTRPQGASVEIQRTVLDFQARTKKPHSYWCFFISISQQGLCQSLRESAGLFLSLLLRMWGMSVEITKGLVCQRAKVWWSHHVSPGKEVGTYSRHYRRVTTFQTPNINGEQRRLLWAFSFLSL